MIQIFIYVAKFDFLFQEAKVFIIEHICMFLSKTYCHTCVKIIFPVRINYGGKKNTMFVGNENPEVQI